MFRDIPNGIPGFAARLPIMFSEGVSKGRIGLEEFVKLTATNPARIMGLYPKKGVIQPGSDADIVVLATPSGLHPQQVIEIAAAGVDAMTEKPMATRWTDGLAMVRACDEAGVRLFVVKQNRRNRTLQYD